MSDGDRFAKSGSISREPQSAISELIRGAVMKQARAYAKDQLTARVGPVSRGALERLFDAGQAHLQVILRDGMTYTLQYGAGQKLVLELPVSPYGTVLDAQLVWGEDPRGGRALESVDIRFRSIAEMDGQPVPLSRNHLPRVLTPAALMNDEHTWRSVLTDTSADLAIERIHVARDGTVTLDGEARLLGGLIRRPVHETSPPGEGADWTRALAKLGVGLAQDTPDAWMRALAQIVGACRFDISLEGATGRGPGAHLLGEAGVRDLGSFELQAKLGLETKRGLVSLELEARHDGEREEGRARVSTSMRGPKRPEAHVDLGQVRWNEFGVKLDAIDVDALAPVALVPPGPLSEVPRLGSPSFVRLLEKRLGDALHLQPTRSVRFLPSGERLHVERLELIRRARAGDTLLLQTYIFRDDDSGQSITKELILAAARGVNVRVLLDAVGSLDGDLLDGAIAPGSYRRLQDAGVPVRLVKNPVRALAEVREALGVRSKDEASPEGEPLDLARRVLSELGRDHRKRLMLYGERPTGRVAEILIGGNNIGDEYDRSPLAAERRSQPHGRGFLWLDGDLHIESEGLVAQDARDFARTWSDSGGSEDAPLPPSAPSSESAASSEGPELGLFNDRPLLEATQPEDGHSHFSNLLLTTFSSLGRGDRLYLETPYLVFLPELHQALEGASRAGARIQIVTNGPYEPNDATAVAEHTRWFHLRSLLDAGVEVFERQAGARPVHQKSFVALDRKGRSLYAIGTPNCDQLSSRFNREAFVLGGTMLGKLKKGGDTHDPVELGLLDAFRRHSKGEGVRRLQREDVRFPKLETLLELYGRAVFHPVF